MTMHSRIWNLQITTFRGTAAFGAMHSYAALSSPDDDYQIDGKWFDGHSQDYRVERVLTEEAAAELNKLNERFGRDYAMDWGAGDSVHQFDTDREAEEYGIFAWQHVCKDPTAVLLGGSSAIAGPRKPYAGPQEVLDVLQPIWDLDESETSNAWTEIRQEADRQWMLAVKDLDLLEHRPGGMRHVFNGGPGHPEKPRTIVIKIEKRDDGLFVVDDTEEV